MIAPRRRLRLIELHGHAITSSPLVERLRLGVQRGALLDRYEAFRAECLPGLCDSSEPTSQFLLSRCTRFLAHDLAAVTLHEIRLLLSAACLLLLSFPHHNLLHLAFCNLADLLCLL